MTPLEQEKQKLAILVKKQEMMKAANKIVASKNSDAEKIEKLKQIGFSEETAKGVLKPDFANRVGFPSYALTNNNAKINTQKAKVLTLEAAAEKEEIKEQIGETGFKTYIFDGGTFVVEEDRVRIYYDEKPSEEQREQLKRAGWKWSYANKAWQRYVTDASILSAQRITGGKLDAKTAPEIEYKSFQNTENAAENFEKKKFTFVSIYFNNVQKRLGIQGRESRINLVIFTHSSVEAKELLTAWLKTQMPSDLADIVTFHSYPQTYIRESKRLYDRKMYLPNPGLSLYGQFPELGFPDFTLQGKMDFDAANDAVNDAVDAEKPKTTQSPNNLEIGDYVKFVNLPKERNGIINPLINKAGVITHIQTDDVKVNVFGYGLEGFMPKSLVKISKEEFEEITNPLTDSKSEFQKELERQKSLGLVEKKSPAISIMGMMSGKDNPVDKLREEETISTPKTSLNPSSYKNQFLLNEAIRQYVESNNLTIDNCLQRTYTEEEKQFLRSYTGYGGLGQYDKEGKADVLRIMEFYTPNKIIKIMWGLAYKNGYKANQSVFEPSAGTGEFLKYTNPETVVEAIEISKISSVICQILYPHVRVYNMPFEQMFIAKNFTVKDKINSKFDLVIGNPPYASFERLEPEAAKYLLGMGEKDYTKARNYVEYFLRRCVDLLNPGGLLVFIIGAEVMNGGELFMDSPKSPVKDFLHQHTQLLEAYRLPAGVFDNTNVTSEILVLKKL